MNWIKYSIFIIVVGFATILHARSLTDIPQILTSNVSAPKPEAVSWALVDHNTGWVLTQHNTQKRVAPASLSKIMTSYVVFEALTKGAINLSDKVRISEKAWRTGGSRMFLDLNSRVTIEDLIKGLVIQSGNDAAVALAEYVAGDVDNFAKMMNQVADKLGMTNSHFTNSHGLPDPDHYTTANDLMLLTTDLIDKFPEYYSWYKEKEFTYNKITQKNRNRLLWQNENIDGIKTGYTSEAGYCLIGSEMRQGMRLTAIVTGAKSAQARTRAVESLLQFGFSYYEHLPVYKRGDSVIELPVFKGTSDTVIATVQNNVGILVPRGESDKVTAEITTQKNIIAPLAANSQVGLLSLKIADTKVYETVLIITDEVDTGSIWNQLFDHVRLWWLD